MSLARAQTIAIIGKSRVGSSLAARLKEGNTGMFSLVVHLPARSSSWKALAKGDGPEVIIIATKDDTIAETALKAAAEAGTNLKLLVHVAGSQSPLVLPEIKDVARLMLHPAQTFPKADASLFQGITFGCSSPNKEALNWAKAFTKAIGAREIITLKESALPLYHATVVFASNAIVLLGRAIEVLSKSIGQNPKEMKLAIRPLMRQAMNNVLSKEASEVFTGPIRRGDSETIKKHQKALREVSPDIKKLYDAFLHFAIEQKLNGPLR